MKKLLLFILIIPFLLTGCENRKFEFVGTINVDNSYEVDQTGFFDEGYAITKNDLLNMIDVPEEAEITEVNIESISVQVVVLENNEANAVSLSGAFDSGTGKIQLFEDYPAVLIKVDAPFVGLNSLIADGVEKIKNKIEGCLKGDDDTGFSIWVYGDSTPTSGNRIHTNILLRITGSIKYTTCESVIFFIEGGDPC